MDLIRFIIYAILCIVSSCAANGLFSANSKCKYARVVDWHVEHLQDKSTGRVSDVNSFVFKRKDPLSTRATPKRAVRVGNTQSNLIENRE
jgi:hypothetical protein